MQTPPMFQSDDVEGFSSRFLHCHGDMQHSREQSAGWSGASTTVTTRGRVGRTGISGGRDAQSFMDAPAHGTDGARRRPVT